MPTDPKPTFSGWKFMLVAVLLGTALWAANAGAQAALKAWADGQYHFPDVCTFCNLGAGLTILGVDLLIIGLYGVALGVFVVRLSK